MNVRELKIVYTDPTHAPKIDGRKPLSTPALAAAILLPILEHESQEVFGVLILDTKHRLLGWQECHRGTLDGCNVHPRDIFRAALMLNAAWIILAHNHPSGDPTPSPDDLELTVRLRAAGDLLGVSVLDHIVIGHQRYVSFKETGRL